MNHIEAVEIPESVQIKGLRAQIGTQPKCAKMAQVGLRTWQMWETGERVPSKSAWGMFLLAIDKHPEYVLQKR